MTHINFGALDKLDISPLGVYGSKSEIVRYLSDKDLVDQDVYVVLVETYLFTNDIENLQRTAPTCKQGRTNSPYTEAPSIGLVPSP